MGGFGRSTRGFKGLKENAKKGFSSESNLFEKDDLNAIDKII